MPRKFCIKTKQGCAVVEEARKDDLEDFFPTVKKALCLEDIQIKPEFQNQGYGTKLMQDVLKKATCPIILHAYSREKRLIQFYSRFGFKHVGCGWMIRQPA